MHERLVASSETSGLRARGEDSIARNAPLSLSLLSPPSSSLSLSLFFFLSLGRRRFSQKHAKYPAGCADTRDTRKERKAEFRKLIQPPSPPISLMVISNRKLLFTMRRTLSLARRQAGSAHKENRNRYPSVSGEIYFIGLHLACGAKFHRNRKQSGLKAETSCIERSRIKVSSDKTRLPLFTWEVNSITKHRKIYGLFSSEKHAFHARQVKNLLFYILKSFLNNF